MDNKFHTNGKRVAKNTVYLYIRMLLIMIISLFTSRIVLQTLGAVDFGLYNVIGGIVVMFGFLNSSLAAAASRYITFEMGRGNNGAVNKVFNAALFTHIAIAIIIVILAETVGLWFFYNKMTIPSDRMYAAFIVYQLSILSTFIMIPQAPYSALIIAHENMKIYAYVGIYEVITKLLIVYLLYISPMDKLIFYALLLFVQSVSLILFYRIYCIRKYKESRIMICKDKALYKSMFKYTGSDLIGQLSGLAQGQGLNLILNVFWGPSVNAARAIAYQVQGNMVKFSNGFMASVKPQIIKAYAAGNIDEMFQLVKRSACMSYYLMLLISLPVCLEADGILKIWLGTYPSHTVSFLYLVVAWCLVNLLKEPRGTIIHAVGKLFFANTTVGIITCMAFPVAYLFAKLGYEPESVFLSGFLTILLAEIIGVFIVRRYIKFSVIKYFVSVHVRCLVVTVLSALLPIAVCKYLMDYSFVRIIITSLTSFISVAIFSFYIGMDKKDKNKIINMIKSKVLKK